MSAEAECVSCQSGRPRIKQRGQQLRLGVLESLNELAHRVVPASFVAQRDQNSLDCVERDPPLNRRTQPHRQAESTRAPPRPNPRGQSDHAAFATRIGSTLAPVVDH